MARPTLLTPALREQIIGQLEFGKSLREICAAEGMPNRSTVHDWIANNVQGFAAQYARAKETGLDQLAEECLQIADSPLIGEEVISRADGGVETRRGDMLGHRRLQIETRLKLLAKLAPKKYGDLQKIEHSGGVDIAATILAARRRSGLAVVNEEQCSPAAPLLAGVQEKGLEEGATGNVAAALIAARRRAGIGRD